MKLSIFKGQFINTLGAADQTLSNFLHLIKKKNVFTINLLSFFNPSLNLPESVFSRM